MSLNLQNYHFSLPKERIARYPLKERENSRMMVLNRRNRTWEHRSFEEFPLFVNGDDLVILNDTKVLPARIFTEDGKVEILYLSQKGKYLWECITRPGKRTLEGAEIQVGNSFGKVVRILENGHREIKWQSPPCLKEDGNLALPPYLEREAEERDQKRYQTVFARKEGSIAAPTAGLHFTKSILEKFSHTFLTLHIGPGTFQPIRCNSILKHQMHAEQFEISQKTAREISKVRGRRIAVGTTVTRVLEHLVFSKQMGKATEGRTDIFLYPPYQFQAVDALLTNFHLPKSTLFVLICAFCGREFALSAYEEAIQKHYRFYSYGDCMLIL